METHIPPSLPPGEAGLQRFKLSPDKRALPGLYRCGLTIVYNAWDNYGPRAFERRWLL